MDNKEIVDKLLCMSCLCVGRALHNVTNEKMQTFYLQILNEIPLCNTPEVCPSICWECIITLRKAVTFKEQVKNSYRILQTYTSENLYECLLTDITRPPRLKVHNNDPVVIPPVTRSSQEKVSSENFNEEKTGEDRKERKVMVYVKDEVKQEWDGQDTFLSQLDDPTHFDDTPLSDQSDNIAEIETEIESLLVGKEKKKRKKTTEDKIRRAKKIVKRLKNGNKIKMKLKHSKRNEAGQKILTIELSYEDMLLERERDSHKQSYVQAQYKCDSCLIGFNYEKSYKSHLATKHSSNLGDYSCPICKTIIASVESFTAHYKRHMRRYECSLCQKRTMDMKVMQQHYHSAHEISLRQYSCNICGKVSKSIDSHRYHKDTHKARVQCPDCDKTFSHRAGLMNHRLAVHELKNEFPCTLCDKVFRWKTSLKRHLEKHDSKDKFTSAAFCTPCGITFSSVSSYQRHLRNSLKHVTPHQLRFICDHCNRRFADKTKLRDHIEEKHLHRTFQCLICRKPAKNRVGLDQHIRNVHKGRPNNKMCHHCGKGFPTKMQLESHIRTHTGERPFICEFCPTTFSQQSNLYKHNRQVHLNIKTKRYGVAKKPKEEQIIPPVELPPPPAPALHYNPDRSF